MSMEKSSTGLPAPIGDPGHSERNGAQLSPKDPPAPRESSMLRRITGPAIVSLTLLFALTPREQQHHPVTMTAASPRGTSVRAPLPPHETTRDVLPPLSLTPPYQGEILEAFRRGDVTEGPFRYGLYVWQGGKDEEHIMMTRFTVPENYTPNVLALLKLRLQMLNKITIAVQEESITKEEAIALGNLLTRARERGTEIKQFPGQFGLEPGDQVAVAFTRQKIFFIHLTTGEPLRDEEGKEMAIVIADDDLQNPGRILSLALPSTTTILQPKAEVLAKAP